jgi:hypothetical protein
MAEFQKPDKDKAVFKLLVIFKDGAKRTYYNYHTSYNAERKKVIIDESVALKKIGTLADLQVCKQVYNRYNNTPTFYRADNEILRRA